MKNKNNIYKILICFTVMALVLNVLAVRAEEMGSTTEEINLPNPPLEEGQESNPPSPLYQGGEASSTPEIAANSNEPWEIVLGQDGLILDPLSATETGASETASSTDANTPWEIVLGPDGLFINSDTANGTTTSEMASSTGENILVPLVKGDEGGLSQGNIFPPQILASWQMNIIKDSSGKYQGFDDDAGAGAQFLPSGEFSTSKGLAMCAAVAYNGSAVKEILADIYYPQNISIASNSETGCGRPLGDKMILSQLTKDDAKALICNRIRNYNNNLLVWAPGFDYSALCSIDGQLEQGTVGVYCAEFSLAYSDPAGAYRVSAQAQSQVLLSSLFESEFTYLELTALESDFSNIYYGAVKLNQRQVIGGDAIFSLNDGLPTVRNIGNTRLNVKVRQNDMGLGRNAESNDWNLAYSARVGDDGLFTNYSPEINAILDKALNLGETKPIDFAVTVFNFLPADSPADYSGQMTLSADKAQPLICQ